MAASSRFKDTLPSYYSQSARRKSLDAPSTTPPPSLVNSAADQTAPFLAIGTNSPPPPTHAIVIKANPVTNQPALPKRPRRPTRPSLSDQLATIGLQADSLVKSLTKSNSNPPSSTSFTLPTLSMAVGRVDCKFPSPATFSKSECQFQFLLGTRDIAMHMYYHDMADVVFDKRALTLRFKIGHPLAEFGADYDFRNRNHAIVIGLASVSDWTKAKAIVLANSSTTSR